jgi:hypothetical protein
MSASSSAKPRLAVAPKPAIKPFGLQDAPVSISQLSTSKVWVLPPRPKPGRKPSTDTPPTKRKAQNRDAQRAFRERRAARVSELEELLDNVVKNKNDSEDRIIDSLKTLGSENKKLRQEMMALQAELDNIRKMKSSIVSPSPSVETDDYTTTSSNNTVIALPNMKFHISDYSKHCAPAGLEPQKRKLPLQQNLPSADHKQPLPKRAKRVSETPLQDAMEMDFTAIFAKKQQAPSTTSISPLDKSRSGPCGFCPEGTKCVCTSDYKYHQAPQSTTMSTSNRLRMSSIFSDLPLSVVPVDQLSMKSKLESVANRSSSKTSSYECTGNPGTCMQCQSDPMSTLFCTTLANRVYASTTVESSRHNISQESARTKAISLRAPKSSISDASGVRAPQIELPPGTPAITTPSGTFIPCSAAYKALSRHKEFSRVDLGKIVGKLNTRGMQVEVSSVANILRELDKKNYQ